jgi:hypothetical protein
VCLVNKGEDTVLKEASDFSKAMWRNLLDVLVMAELRVVSTYCYDFVILFTLHQDCYNC